MSDAAVNKEEISEEWKQYSVLLNDFHSSYSLPWPCGFCKWVTAGKTSRFRGWTVCGILLGTCATEECGRFAIGRVAIPRKNRGIGNGINSSNFDILTEEQGRDSVNNIAQPLVMERMVELGDNVFEVSQMPQSIDKMAVITSEDLVFFDWKKCSQDTETGVSEVKLRGSERMGHSLSWSTLVKGYLLCASENCTIGLWDINRPDENTVLMANVNFIHDRKINAVSWHCLHETLFGSVGDDNHLLIWDTRFTSRYRPVLAALAHSDRALCLSFNHFSEYLVATGSADKSIAIWDIRNLTIRVHTLPNPEQDEVTQIAWSPHEQAVIASRGTSSKIAIWDLDRINCEGNSEQSAEIPPELLFIQGDHEGRVIDFSWNPTVPWLLCSLDTQSLHLWHVVGAPKWIRGVC